jgi:hypothetical protein
MFLCEVTLLDKDQKGSFLTIIKPTGLSSLSMSRNSNGLFATDFSVQRVFPTHKKKDIWIVDYWTNMLSRHSSNRSPQKLHGNKIPSDTTGNRSRDLPTSSTVPEPLRYPRPRSSGVFYINKKIERNSYLYLIFQQK